MAKKLKKEELSELRVALQNYNRAKVELADNELRKQMILNVIKEMKDNFGNKEKVLLQKYGKDAKINLETGEITQTQKEKVNG
jgi:seryl-tRNA(Sec) selenium transferase